VSAVAEATAWYVYGVVHVADAHDAAVSVVQEGRLAAVVARVPLADFGEDVLAERLNDRVWLEEHARAHQDVLQEVAGRAAVVPFRFGTIYRELADVHAMLRERDAELAAALERIRGRVELGVKAWAPAAETLAAPEPATGRAYLQQRLGARDAARAASAAVAETAQVAHDRLLAHAVAGVANRPQPRELTERDERMILNGAYLVADRDGFVAELERLRDEYRPRGVSFELTGPWPPYNFVDQERDA
jgi:hypothetical protein